MIYPPCKVCDKGIMQPQRVNRMSGPSVTIGYILLVPSAIGILLSLGVMLFLWVSAASAANTKTRPFALSEQARNALVAASVKEETIKRIENGEPEIAPDSQTPNYSNENAGITTKDPDPVTDLDRAREAALRAVREAQETRERLSPAYSSAIIQARLERKAFDDAQKSMNSAKIGAAGCLGGCGTVIGVIGLILSFVGGLLGWLLIMKKNVLKCTVCGAIVPQS